MLETSLSQFSIMLGITYARSVEKVKVPGSSVFLQTWRCGLMARRLSMILHVERSSSSIQTAPLQGLFRCRALYNAKSPSSTMGGLQLP
jgi:hypothetical protein